MNIGMNGVARIRTTTAKVRSVAFALNAQATKVISLDPTKRYKLFASGAGPSDLVVSVSQDDPNMGDQQKFAAPKTYAAMAAAGGYLGTVSGATAVKVQHTKNGSGTDDAATVALLGGRCQVRAVEIGTAVDGEDATTGLGDYTALTAT